MLDKIFAAVGMLGVIAFMGVVTVFVMEPDLWIVTLVVLAIAIIFIWREVRIGGSHLEVSSSEAERHFGDRTAP